MPGRTTTIRLTDDDQAVIAALQKHTGIQSTTELIRYALRITAQRSGVAGFGPSRPVGIVRTRTKR